MKIASAVFSALAVATAQPVSANTAPTRALGVEVRVSGMGFGNFRDFKPDGEIGVFLQGRGSDWYYASFAQPCPGFQWARAIGATSASDGDTFDRRSHILFDGNSCPLKSVVTAPRPYGKTKNWRPERTPE